jgi:hypothetical protein
MSKAANRSIEISGSASEGVTAYSTVGNVREIHHSDAKFAGFLPELREYGRVSGRLFRTFIL